MSYYSDNALIEKLVVKDSLLVEGDCIITGALTADVSGLTADFTVVDASIVILRNKDVVIDASIVALQGADKTFATNASVGTALNPFATNASIGVAGFVKKTDFVYVIDNSINWTAPDGSIWSWTVKKVT
jgi:hypothetical protein